MRCAPASSSNPRAGSASALGACSRPTLNVRGQALARGGGSIGLGVVEALPTDAPRQLNGRAAPTARSELEPNGEFALSNLERGRYDVLLRLGTREIELCGVEF